MKSARILWLSGIALVPGFAIAPGPAAVAASRPADLKIELESYDQAKHEAHLKVTNIGDDAAPATTLQVRTFAPGAGGNPVSVSVPALKGSGAFEYVYNVECSPGVRMQAQDTLAGDPTPENNVLITDPCLADLTLTFLGRQYDQDLRFLVSNIGGIAAPATTAHFETETTPPSNPADIKLPPLGPGQSKTVDYVMNAPCPGLAVKGVKGGVASPSATVQLATVKPAPPSNQRAESIPALDPGASYTVSYSLASACDGNDVKAPISLDADPHQANLATQVTACDPIPPDVALATPTICNRGTTR